LNEDFNCTVVDKIYTSADSEGISVIPEPFVIKKICKYVRKLKRYIVEWKI